MDDEEIEERFSSIGPVSIRRMFGGKGIYRNGRIIAIVHSGELWLKTDATSAPAFEAAGCRRWAYARDGKAPVVMPYYTLPDDALDDSDAMAEWAQMAVDAAERAPPPKPKRRTRT